MKKFTLVLVMIIASANLFAQDKTTPATETDDVEETVTPSNEQIVTGKVVKIGDTWLIEMTNEDGHMDRLLPGEMPETMKKEGLEVVFSGVRGTIPPNVRVMGVPFELEMIREIEKLDDQK